MVWVLSETPFLVWSSRVSTALRAPVMRLCRSLSWLLRLLPAALGVIAGAIDQRLQGLQLTAQLLQGVLGVKQCAAGLHLAHDAAALFAGVDRAVVDAALDIAGLAAHDAADVITDVQVAHGAAVEAGADHAGGGTSDTANVGDVSGILGANQIVQRQLREVDFVLVDGGVDVGVVAALMTTPWFSPTMPPMKWAP